MKIGNYNSLADMARKAPHDDKYVENLRNATSEIFDRTIDTLLVDRSATAESKNKCVEELKDLRLAMLVSVRNVETTREQNYASVREVLDNIGDKKAEIKKEDQHPDPQSIIRRVYSDTEIRGPKQNNSLRYSRDFMEDNSDQMVGPKNFLIGLNGVIGMASAVAALPPGASSAMVSSLPNPGEGQDGDGSYAGTTTGERLAIAIQELDFQMEQAESKPANKAKVVGEYKEKVIKSELVKRFKIFPRIQETVVSTDEKTKLFHETEFEPERLWLPESGTSQFETYSR